MKRFTKTSIEINLSDLDEDDLLGYVRLRYGPSDVFTESILGEWSLENGFKRDPEA